MLRFYYASQVLLVVKNLPTSEGDMRDSSSIPGSGRSPGEGNGTYFRILAWKIPWTEEPGRLQSMGLQRVRQLSSEAPHSTYMWLGFLGGTGGKEPCCQCRRCKRRGNPGWGRPPGERNDNQLRYSRLEEPGGLQPLELQRVRHD